MSYRFIQLFIVTLLAGWLCGSAQGRAQNKDKSPLAAWEQLAEQQQKYAAQRLKDKTPPKDAEAELERFNESLRQSAHARASQFKISDWQDDELLGLAQLHTLAEGYLNAAEAYRLYLKRDAPKRAGARNKQVAFSVAQNLVAVLLEADRVEEAAAEMKLIESSASAYSEVRDLARNLGPNVATRQAGLLVELASAWFERSAYDKALLNAQAGYEWTYKWNFVGEELPSLAMRLAAFAQAALERTGKTKDATDWRARLEREFLKTKPELRAVFEAELVVARLIGQPPPELVAARWLNGTGVKLAAWRGQVVMLDFWAMWCVPCWRAFPYQRDWQKQFSGKGFALVGVTRFYGRSDAKEDLAREQEWQALQAFKDKHQLSYPIAVGKMDDISNEEPYGITALPATILIDRQGKVRLVKRGGGDYRKLAQRLAKLIAEPAGPATN